MEEMIGADEDDQPELAGTFVPPDAELVSSLVDGDARAFEILVRNKGPRMLAAIRRIIRDDALAQDCLQDSFINVLRGIGQFRGGSSLSTWLHRIAINSALMRLRKTKRTNEASIDDLLPEFDDNDCRIEPTWQFTRSPESEAADGQIQAMVREKIDNLPDDYRVILLLRDIEGYSAAEAAEAIGITETNAKVRLHRARSALKKLLEPIWVSHDR